MSKEYLMNIRRHLIGALKHIETLLKKDSDCEHEFIVPYEQNETGYTHICIKCGYRRVKNTFNCKGSKDKP